MSVRAIISAVGVIAALGCVESLPTDADFGLGAPCPAGELRCDGACVPEDAQNCGACGVVCPGGSCKASACERCVVVLADHSVEPLRPAPGAEILALECPNVQRNGLYRVRVQAQTNVSNDVCNSQLGQCARWTLEADIGVHVEFPGGGCADSPGDAVFQVQQDVNDLPAPAAGPIRVRLRAEVSTVAGCDGLATYLLSTQIEVALIGHTVPIEP